MTDKELAEALIAMNIGQHWNDSSRDHYRIDMSTGVAPSTAGEYVYDDIVAMEVIRHLKRRGMSIQITQAGHDCYGIRIRESAIHDSQTLTTALKADVANAIILAGVRALTGVAAG